MSPVSPPVKKTKTISEGWFDIIEGLCNRFMGLSPFEVMNTDLCDVYNLYVDVIIHDKKEKKQPISNGEWVTSKTATWH